MHDFTVSDIMISDTSSILYEYLITRNPIIVAANSFNDLHTMPDDMNIMKHTTIYDGTQNIVEIIDDNIKNQKFKDDYDKLLHNCFYFNDGKSVKRAIDFLNTL